MRKNDIFIHFISSNIVLELKWNGWETVCHWFLLAFLDLTVHNVQ